MTGDYDLGMHEKLNRLFRTLTVKGKLQQAHATDDIFAVYEKICMHLKDRRQSMPWRDAQKIRLAIKRLNALGAACGISFRVPWSDIDCMDAAVVFGSAIDAYHRAT